ncbi:MAG: hypothetical protein J3K34DRAFT_73240 [Monoraphidium minutum]|nr:MAG: hypothetical protein J3K34DRAFT_73240 [Monoraphidium minutum]
MSNLIGAQVIEPFKDGRPCVCVKRGAAPPDRWELGACALLSRASAHKTPFPRCASRHRFLHAGHRSSLNDDKSCHEEWRAAWSPGVRIPAASAASPRRWAAPASPTSRRRRAARSLSPRSAASTSVRRARRAATACRRTMRSRSACAPILTRRAAAAAAAAAVAAAWARSRRQGPGGGDVVAAPSGSGTSAMTYSQLSCSWRCARRAQRQGGAGDGNGRQLPATAAPLQRGRRRAAAAQG